MAKGTTNSTPNGRLARVFPYLLIVGGAIGIVCSLILVHDQIKIWQDPAYVPACSLNPVVSCGTVIHSNEGDVFGIPAPFFGLLVFPVVTTVGVALLAGARFSRWFWQALTAGMLGGVAFALWLFFLSMYRIGALCPFCLTVDVVIYTLAWYTLLHAIQAGFVPLPRRLAAAAAFAQKHHAEILVVWLLALVALILQHFWYYYGQYI